MKVISYILTQKQIERNIKNAEHNRQITIAQEKWRKENPDWSRKPSFNHPVRELIWLFTRDMPNKYEHKTCGNPLHRVYPCWTCDNATSNTNNDILADKNKEIMQ